MPTSRQSRFRASTPERMERAVEQSRVAAEKFHREKQRQTFIDSAEITVDVVGLDRDSIDTRDDDLCGASIPEGALVTERDPVSLTQP